MRALAAALLLAVAAACNGGAGDSSLFVDANSPASFGPLPEVPLVDATGAEVSPARLKGSTWALTCLTRPLPMQTAALLDRLEQVHQVLGSSDIHLVMVTVDPTVDTPEVLAQFATERGLGTPGRHLWTGTEANVASLLHGAYRSALVGATADQLERQMSVAFEARAVVIDAAGQVRGTYDLWTDSGDSLLVERLKAVARE